jgi:two-component system, NtrC family, nitrogen regulation response regulator NtrX
METLASDAQSRRLGEILHGPDWEGNGRVLVIEDDPSTREVIEEILTEEGCEVRIAFDGKTALHLLEGWQPSLILLDLRMPDMDGATFAAAYRKLAGPHAPIVLVTATSKEAATEAALAISAVAVIRKPFDLTEMLEVVERYSPCVNAN